MNVADVIAGKRIVICGGSGGVGKTTTSAAIAMGAAAAGRKVAVVTIDPAKRLANSLGLEELGNEPALVDPDLFAPAGVEMEGELWAMMRLPTPAGRRKTLIARPWKNPVSLVGASRKSSALRDGGVSSTSRS